MYVRLAFAVASHLSADIILIDEILGVGDQEFRTKCLEKLVSASEDGRTVLIVSHQMTYLKKYCKSGIHLHSGRLMYHGSIEDTIQHYLSSHAESSHQQIHLRKDRKGDGRGIISALRLLDHAWHDCPVLHAGQELNIELRLESSHDVLPHVEIRIDCIDQLGHQWFVLNNNVSGTSIRYHPSGEVIICTIPKLPLNEGIYTFDISLFVENKLSDYVPFATRFTVEKGMFYDTGKLPSPTKGMLLDYHWKVNPKAQ
jgi:lipopolysaccharide transport system ATP-binding protein